MTEQEFRQEVENLINSAPEEYRPRLRGIQWECDMLREKHKDNPVKLMLALQEKMMSSANNLTEALQKLHENK